MTITSWLLCISEFMSYNLKKLLFTTSVHIVYCDSYVS